jgi:hypothetical protein
MRQFLIIFFILLNTINFGFSQGFKENSIGVAFFVSETESEYGLEIVFPFQCLTDFKIENRVDELIETSTKFKFNSQLTLFDESGEIGSIEIKDSIEIRFWCENDGGIQFRPTLNLKVKKHNLKRVLRNNFEIENVACFSIVNRNLNTVIKQVSNTYLSNEIQLKGDIDDDGKIEVLIWSELDESGICDHSFHLVFNEKDYYLNCCGP